MVALITAAVALRQLSTRAPKRRAASHCARVPSERRYLSASCHGAKAKLMPYLICQSIRFNRDFEAK